MANNWQRLYNAACWPIVYECSESEYIIIWQEFPSELRARCEFIIESALARVAGCDRFDYHSIRQYAQHLMEAVNKENWPLAADHGRDERGIDCDSCGRREGEGARRERKALGVRSWGSDCRYPEGISACSLGLSAGGGLP